MRKTAMIAAFAATLISGAAMADPIEGNWKTQSGETAAIAKCGGAYCVTLKTGSHAGKRIGQLSGSDGSYSGTLTDPEDNKTYSGSAKVSGASMRLKGCALKIFCQTQNWKKM